MSEMITIAVDAIGGDFGAPVVLDGVEQALKEDPNLQVIVCGPADAVVPFAESHERCIAQECTEAIAMDEHPAQAVRKKKDSSIVVGCRLVKEGVAQGFFSAGSTGACLTAATLVMGRIKGVMRPAIATIIPSPAKPVVMCDVGANADCKPPYLVQFAQMAAVYAEQVIGINDPTVALLNIGSEDTKGSQFSQEAFALMKDAVPNFIGNKEGCDILPAGADVFVTDGFTGNVCLKTIEGTSKTLFGALKEVMMENTKTKLAALALKDGLDKLKKSIDPDTYGGAPLLGVNGACLIGHGSSNATAIKNGVAMTAKTVRLDVSGIIERTVKKDEELG